MHLVDTSIFGLLAAGLITSIIELGLSADIVHIFDGYYWWGVDSTAESRSDFLLFCSIWSILVTVLLLLIPLLGRNVHGHSLTSPVTLVLTALTMIFWLAGFAAFANLFVGAPTGTAGATLAFAVIAWSVNFLVVRESERAEREDPRNFVANVRLLSFRLIFLALFVLNLLTALSVRASDRPGWTPFGRVRVEKRSGETTITTTA